MAFIDVRNSNFKNRILEVRILEITNKDFREIEDYNLEY